MVAERVIDFLRRRGFLAVGSALAVAVAVALSVWYVLPLEYTAEGEIYFAVVDGELGQFKQTELGTLKGREVCRRAVEQPQAAALPLFQSSPDPAAVLNLRVTADSLPEERIIHVKVSDPDPQIAQTLVNAVIQAYVEVARDKKSDETRRLEQQYLKERDDSRAEIEKIKRRQFELARKAGQTDPDAIRGIVESLRREQLDKQNLRQGVQIERIKLQKAVEVLSSAEPELSPDQEERIQAASPDEQRLQQALLRLQAEAEQIKTSSVLGEEDPEYIRRQRFVEEHRKKIAEAQAGRRLVMLEALRKVRDAEVKSKRAQLAALEEQSKILDQSLLALDQKIRTLDETASEIERLRPELAARQNALENANQQLAIVSRQSWVNGVSTTPADLPKLAQSGKKRLAALVAGPIGGFFLVLALFAFADFHVNIVTRPDHLEKMQALPVLGALPKLPDGRRLPGDDDFSPTSKSRLAWLSMNEAINSLRITLTFAPDRADNDGVSSIMITSPRDGEGKSTFAANLAVSLARTGVRTVLVEADMHRPTLFETFGVERSPGLCELLQTKGRVRDFLRETDYPGLSLLSAGAGGADLTPTILPERVAQIMSELRDMFQMVVVDSPPVLPVYDAMVLGQNVDETVLMVRCNYSRFATIGQAQSRLESVGVKVAGIVVCGSSLANRYGYYYDSYHAPGGASSTKSRADRNGAPPAPSLLVRSPDKEKAVS
jgi:capsular exopolysaccharide synthesis family protein